MEFTFEGLTKVAPLASVRKRWRVWRRPMRLRIHGVQVDLEPDWATEVIRKALYEGWYERREVAALRRTLRSGDRYMEVGAGLGVVTSVACSIVSDDRVTVFEANPRLVHVAQGTCKTNGYSPEIINAVLGDKEGRATFYVHDSFWTSSLDESAGGSPIEVPSLAFESELVRIQPSYLMLDIEGAEVTLLAGRSFPMSLRAICMEVHPHMTGNAAVQGLVAHLFDEGFEFDFEMSGGGVIYLERPLIPERRPDAILIDEGCD